MTKEHVNSLELLKQSEEIRKQSDALKKKEAPEVLARIKEAVAHYGFTAADLGLAGGRASAKTTKSIKSTKAGKPLRPPRAGSRQAAPKPKVGGTVKFSDGQGNTWSGFGRKPKWYLAALAAGASLESLKA